MSKTTGTSNPSKSGGGIGVIVAVIGLGLLIIGSEIAGKKDRVEIAPTKISKCIKGEPEYCLTDDNGKRYVVKDYTNGGRNAARESLAVDRAVRDGEHLSCVIKDDKLSDCADASSGP